MVVLVLQVSVACHCDSNRKNLVTIPPALVGVRQCPIWTGAVTIAIGPLQSSMGADGSAVSKPLRRRATLGS